MTRRRLLTRALGASLALPLLEGQFSTDRGAAHAASSRRRFVAVYIPNGVIYYGGFSWYPTGTKTAYSLMGTSLQALERHRQRLSVFKGIASAGLNGNGSPHMRAITSFLTGAGIPAQTVTRHSTSIDQFIADRIASATPTRVHSLSIAANNELDPPNGRNYNNNLKNGLIWDKSGNQVRTNPDLKAIFDKSFGGAAVTGTPDPEGARRRALLRTSVLDTVMQDLKGVRTLAGAEDRRRLDQYTESLRALEARLKGGASQPSLGSACTPARPFPAYPQRLDAIGPHVKDTAELLALAFQCDLTRVVAYMLGGEGAGCRYTDIGINKHFHNELSHHGNNAGKIAQHAKVDAYHAELLALLLDRLQMARDLDGSVLDNTLVLFGSGMGQGDAHTIKTIHALVAGNIAGQVKHGFHANLESFQNGALLLSLIRLMGIEASGFGDNKDGKVIDLRS